MGLTTIQASAIATNPLPRNPSKHLALLAHNNPKLYIQPPFSLEPTRPIDSLEEPTAL